MRLGHALALLSVAVALTALIVSVLSLMATAVMVRIEWCRRSDEIRPQLRADYDDLDGIDVEQVTNTGPTDLDALTMRILPTPPPYVEQIAGFEAGDGAAEALLIGRLGVGHGAVKALRRTGQGAQSLHIECRFRHGRWPGRAAHQLLAIDVPARLDPSVW